MITAAEVIKLTPIRKGTDTGLIGKELIDIIQEDFLRPVLGNDFYESLKTEIADDAYTGSNETLHKDYIKPMLAFYVWWKVLPSIHMQTTNHGIQSNFSEFSQTGTDQQRGDLMKSAQDCGDSKCAKLVRYLDDNHELFPLYDQYCKSVKNNLSKTGGIIISKK